MEHRLPGVDETDGWHTRDQGNDKFDIFGTYHALAEHRNARGTMLRSRKDACTTRADICTALRAELAVACALGLAPARAVADRYT
jgi:hypothetical protein